MAGDTFDPLALKSAQEALIGMERSASRTADQMHDISRAMQEVAVTRARMEELRILDPKAAEDAMKMVSDMERKLLELKVPYAQLLAIRAKEKDAVTKEVNEMAKLAQSAKIEDKHHSRIAQTIKNKAKGVANYASSMAGVQLSLVGIIAMIIEGLNNLNRISAMSKQIVNQWGVGHKHMSGMSRSIVGLQAGFKMTFTEAGNYLKSLSMMGYSYKQLMHIHKEMLAIQFAQGQSVQDQAMKVKDLINNYQQTDENSMTYLWTLRKSAQEMHRDGGVIMSMQEMVDSTMELADKTKVYNKDLLGTSALFNVLASKKLADRIGLGDVPLNVRKSIAGTIAGMSRDLEDGWKAALGKGATVAQRILNFEKMLPEEKFKSMAEFITKQTSRFSQDTKQLATRQLLSQLGFTSKEAQKVMAQAFTKGGFSGTALEGVMQAIREQRDHLKKLEGEAPKQRDKLIREGKNIATGLTTLQTRLKQWVERTVLPIVKSMRDGILAIKNKIMGTSPTEDFAKKNLEQRRIWKEFYAPVHKKFTAIAPNLAELGSRAGESAGFMQTLRYSDVIKELMKRNIMTVAEMRKRGAGMSQIRELFAERSLLAVRSVAGDVEFKRVLGMIKDKAVEDALNEIQRVLQEHDIIDRTISPPKGHLPYKTVGGVKAG